MKRYITQSLAIEDSDDEIQQILSKIKIASPYPLPAFVEKENYSWFLVSITLTRKHEPIDGTLYLVQHFGKVGDSGYYAFISQDVFKNRKELDLIIKALEGSQAFSHSKGEEGNFCQKCAEMVKGLRAGASLHQLSKQGFLTVPPPSLN